MLYYHNKRRRADFKKVQLQIKEELKKENRDINSMKIPKFADQDIEVLEIRESRIQQKILKNMDDSKIDKGKTKLND